MNKYLEKIAKVSAFHDTSHDADKQARSVSMPYNFARRLHLSRTEPATHPENDVLHSTPIGHGTPTMHKSAAEQGSSSSGGIGLLGTGGLLGAGAYGKSLYDRTKTLASSTSPSRMTTLGKTQAFKQTVATDVSTGISKAKSFGGLIRSRFPLRAL